MKITIYYDGACPICRTEVSHLQSKAPNNITITPVNEAVEHLEHAGFSEIDAMTYLCVEDDSGHWYTHMDANRLMYAVVGSPLANLLALPVVKQLADVIYPIFARNRYRIPLWVTRLFFGQVVPEYGCGADICRVPPSQRRDN